MGLRVLCLTPWFPNSEADGKFNFILHSVRALADAGHQVAVLVTRPWIPTLLRTASAEWAHAHHPVRVDSEALGASIELIRYPSIPRYVLSEYADQLYRLGTARAIRRLVRAHGIQVIHAHTERAGYAAVAAGRACGVPAVVTLHGISTAPQLLDSAGKRRRLRDTLNAASRVVLVGEPLRAHFAPLAGRDDTFRVVPNGFFLHGHERPAGPFARDVRFVSVANLSEGKGIDLNLRALARLRTAGFINWTYVAIGDGAEREPLARLTRELGLERQVTFLGALSHDRAMQQLAGADVFVLPSYREAFGVAYVEAMAAGLLAIGVHGQGPEAFIEHGRTGLLVRPNDESSLFEALKATLEAPEAMRLVAAAGKAYVRANFTWARHAENLAAVLEEAIGARQ